MLFTCIMFRFALCGFSLRIQLGSVSLKAMYVFIVRLTNIQ